jgi:hypothetical protein
MAQLKDIVEIEKQRDDLAKCRTAWLYRDGSFLRAYEWSAWLFVKYINDFKVSNRQVKSLGQVLAMIGFPPASMEKFTPEGAHVSPQQDGSVMIELPSSLIPDDVDIHILAAEYDEWKNSLPIVESKIAKKERDAPSGDDSTVGTWRAASLHQCQSQSRPATLTGIMQQILAYPLEQKSPVDNIVFLSDIKRQLSSLI